MTENCIIKFKIDEFNKNFIEELTRSEYKILKSIK